MHDATNSFLRDARQSKRNEALNRAELVNVAHLPWISMHLLAHRQRRGALITTTLGSCESVYGTSAYVVAGLRSDNNEQRGVVYGAVVGIVILRNGSKYPNPEFSRHRCEVGFGW